MHEVGAVHAVGCGGEDGLRAKVPALSEHGANTVVGTNPASPLPTKSEQLQSGVLLTGTMGPPWHTDGGPCWGPLGYGGRIALPT